MQLDSVTLARVRDELRSRGARVSAPPAPPAPGGSAPPRSSADVLAVVQRVAPLCEVLYLLMVADQACDAREYEVLRGAVRALTDGALKTAVVDEMLARFEEALRLQGRERRLSQVSAQLAGYRPDAEAAFMLAAAMVIADDAPDARERSLLEELRELLGISEARALALLGEAVL